MAQRTGVLVIEDNRLVRDRLAALLDAQPDFKVVAAADGPDAGLRRVQDSQPQVVLVDASLGNHSSPRVVESVRKTAPQARVVVMDLPPVEEVVVEFAKAGATGFVGKRASIDDLIATVRSVARGAAVVPPSLTGLLCSHIAKRAVDRSAPGATDAVRMSKREREVVGLIAEGLSNKEIGQRLNIATYTVKSHVHNLLEKLTLHSRLQLAVHAYRAGASKTESP
jgi:two-component system NarL family response regulator